MLYGESKAEDAFRYRAGSSCSLTYPLAAGQTNMMT